MQWKILFVLSGFVSLTPAKSQETAGKIQEAYQQFSKDSQVLYATASLYVVDLANGNIVFDINSRIGLAPASTQKTITSVTALAILGSNFQYKTSFLFENKTLHIFGNGDPTFGSWRYSSTQPLQLLSLISARLPVSEIKSFTFYGTERKRTIPSGWIYEDIGNYYGASPGEFNWKENQYDLTFIPGQAGEPAILDTLLLPANLRKSFINRCKTGKAGSGDNAYVYFLPGQDKYVIEGTVPAGVKTFSISAADPEPAITFASELNRGSNVVPVINFVERKADKAMAGRAQYVHSSPGMDSIIYWFNKKSINLYGEALLKTIAFERSGIRSTDTGVTILQNYWKSQGIDTRELNMYDGSGLSPLNRVTTHAQVEVLRFAKKQAWFDVFYQSLPEFNGMRMKSGTISDVKGFCGYHKAKDGTEYVFSFLVNNYSGSASKLVSKMYAVLDALK